MAAASSGRKSYFAAVGDVHGQFRLVVRMLCQWEAEMQAKQPGCRLAFALQVGDIECHRHENDMATMAAPARKRRMGDFADLYNGVVDLPCPTFFIGGNHECYGWLDEDEASEAVDLSSLGLPTAPPVGAAVQISSTGWRRRPKQVAKNLYFLGRAGILTLRIGNGTLRFQTEDLATHYLRSDARTTLLDENHFNPAVLSSIRQSSQRREVNVQPNSSLTLVSAMSSNAEDADDEQGSDSDSRGAGSSEDDEGKLPTAQEEEAAVITIAGLSGIFQEQSYYQKRPSTTHLSTASNKTWIGFNCYDVSRLLSGEGDEDAATEDPSGADEASRFRSDLASAFERCLGKSLDADQSVLGQQDLLRVFQHAAGGSRLGARRALDNYQEKCGKSGLQANSLASLLTFFEERARSLSAGKREALLSRFARSSLVDVLLTHDWPEGLLPEGIQLRGSRPMGNAIAREVTEALHPQLHLCGHMHRPLRTEIRVEQGSGARGAAERADGTKEHIDICCLSKVGLEHSTAFFEYDWDSGSITEVNPPINLPTFVGPGDDVDSSSDD
mmetsp:Transcript_56687/g.123961  ORF Transcript_56687/g.123961 Transcript_56687/m.123961 type:complete len:556 (-) Transcript_56687:268-1935(-)|eukprot:CAMPEP_0206478704 /NCGR_PEP_ID=MMETSP0324_2-20121206/36228_1 /ASSEMBLY_ACC=CAM_ASM_000836 /TAXON_ID=2866 /ORGANISM="Crypthecodinium cohnii, Strain Seligo" /LENGTH=555 /DNA_ID=CAMNT_0053955093 /DNA_START=117 /DNA_END=1784 /DNA_ORIENTATION=+